MDEAQRLLTSIDVDGSIGTGSDVDRQVSIRALLELELASGLRVVLLADRGWGSSMSAPMNIWSYTSFEQMAQTARGVVGPDEPMPGQTIEEATAAHWAHLAAAASEKGVQVDPSVLAALPHDVHVSEQIRQRLQRSAR